ncbi:MAG: Gfo/Idh/MocA family oxidoreductase [Gemmatimonadota bacterium]|nr:Gfo/Idh/MocA family oxidoreductase [Gemmatimonadota bacterium]
MDKIRVGFIGCGGNASGHIGRVLDIPEAEVVALCDVDQASLQRAKERHAQAAELPEFTHYQEMLEQVELDAVEISTPHTLHFEQIMAALDKGLHVLTEKPMVCTVDHARQVIAKSEETSKVVMISYQRHLQAQYRYVRNQIAAGELGDIQFISALQDQKWYQVTIGLWRQQMALSGGGQLNDSGSHLLDIALWMTGLEVAEVQAYMEYFDSEVDINSALSLRFRNGALGTIAVVGNSPTGGMWEDITIWGTKAVVYIRQGQIFYKTQHSNEVYEVNNLPGSTTPDQNFIDAILGRDQVQVPPECGLRVIELTEAAWASAASGQPVKVKSI